MFFILSKLLAFFINPLNLFVCLFLLIALAWWRGWCRFARRAALVCGVAFALCAYTQFPDLLLGQLEQTRDDSILEVNESGIAGIIILGGSLSLNKQNKRDSYHLNGAAERITEGLILARKFPSARVVYSGGNASLIGGHGIEADGFQYLLQMLGGLPNEVLYERKSKNTWQNAESVKRMLRGSPAKNLKGKWILVTSASHMRRAYGAFKKSGFDIIPWPTDYRASILRFPWLSTNSTRQLRKLENVLHETIGILAYRLTGRM